MMNKLKKVSLLVLTGIIGTVYGEYHDKDMDHDHGMDHMHASNMPYGINPQYPENSDNFDFNIGAAYTYWVPYQNGMVLGYNAGDVGYKGQNIMPFEEGWSGFKVHLGMITPHDGWSVFINYTWFNNDPHSKTHTPNNDAAVFTTLYIPGVQAETLTTRWRNQFNRIDGYVDRDYYVGKYTTIRPWVGLLGAFEKQYLNITSVSTDPEDSVTTGYFTGKQHWWGIGPYGGIQSTYFLTEMFGVYLSAGTSLLLSNHWVPETVTVVGPVETQYPLNISPSWNDLEPMLEASLGICMDAFWENWGILINLAWETQTYFFHNGFVPVDPLLGNRGGYSMQGLTLDVGIQF